MRSLRWWYEFAREVVGLEVETGIMRERLAETVSAALSCVLVAWVVWAWCAAF